MKPEPLHYHEYLKLDQLLSAQHLESQKHKIDAKDEHLFVIVHQVYELWFKQILYDMDIVLKTFSNNPVNETDMGLIVFRLERLVGIQKLLIHQIDVLETMTPLDFLDFRHLLYPASGFQSFQFRLLENKLGLKLKYRINYNDLPYYKHLNLEQQELVQNSENDRSLFDCVEKWLSRIPFLEMEDFNFWQSYEKAVYNMFHHDIYMVENNSFLNEAEKNQNLQQIKNNKQLFQSLFDPSQYQKLLDSEQIRLSHKAALGALLIQLYRDQPVLNLPFRLITSLQNIDEQFTQWRYRHALMAKRMLGTKVGTGGSSGAKYLNQATEKHKVFDDFFQLTTFFIPRSSLPKLPIKTRQKMGFVYQKKTE